MPKAKNLPDPIINIITNDTIAIVPFNEAIANSGLEKTKAEKYALGYAPLMREVVEQSDLLKGLDKAKPEDAAKAKRISLDLGKICSRLTTKKKEDKDTLLIETRLIDGLFNVAESTARLTQKEADEIVDYLANIERERLAKLADTRRAELEQYEADTTYLPLDIMGPEQYARCLESAQLAFEARKVAAEKLEAERLQAIKDAELAELERQRIEAERIEAERLESIRIREELATKEQELVKEREIAAAEQKRRDAEIQAERKAAHEKFEAEQKRVDAESKRIAKENESKLKAETERLERVAAQQLAEKQKQNDRQSAMFALGLHWDGQMFHYQDINFHWTDLLCMDDATFDKNLKGATKRMEVLKAEYAECKRREKEADDKYKKELQELRDADAKEAESKRLAQLAPDKDKINALYLSLKNLPIPDFTSVECQVIGTQILNKISHILSYIKEESKKLS